MNGTIPAGFQLSPSSTFSVTGGGNLYISIPLMNPQPGGLTNLIKTGSGDLVLTASNVYTGNTTISAGTLQLGNGGATGSLTTAATATITDNGTLYLDNSGSLVQGTTLSGTNLFTGTGNVIIGAGNVTLNRFNTYSGGTSVNGGTLSLNNGGTSGVIVGNLTINQGGTVNLQATNALGYSGANVVSTVNIYGGQLINSSGNNEGLITNFNLTAGTMSPTSGGYQFNLSGASINTNASTASLVISGPINIQGANLLFNVAQGNVTTGPYPGVDLYDSGVISGGYPISKTGNGLLELTGASTFTGNFTISAGTVEATNTGLGSFTAAGRTVTVGSGTVLELASGNVMGQGNAATPVSGLVIQQGGLVYATVTNSNNQIGPLTLSGGTLMGTGGYSTFYEMFTAGTGSAETITVNGSLPSYISQVAGATSTLNGFQLATSNTFSITGSGGLYVSIPLMDRNNGQGSAALIQTGSGLLVLSASGNYSGGTVVNGGTLQLGNNAALGANTGDLTVNTGGLLDLHGFSPIEGQLGGGGLVDNLISTASTLTVNYDNDTHTFSGTIQNSSGIVSLVKAGTARCT